MAGSSDASSVPAIGPGETATPTSPSPPPSSSSSPEHVSPLGVSNSLFDNPIASQSGSKKPGISVTNDQIELWTSRTLVASLFGTAVGGVWGYKIGIPASVKLLEVNQAKNLYRNPVDARRFVGTQTMSYIARNGLRYGARFGLFTGILGGLQVVATSIRQKDDITNLIAAGSMTGAVFGATAGVRGVAWGTLAGAGASLTFGAVDFGLRYITDQTRRFEEGSEVKEDKQE
eukprot:TRINITY_DN7046_c0_g1_i1.p1 TRINITY_DN7046_c0_g1~~TRINITY_DN7046_c0_g1_i1.p1  ORF type:complete len:231 (-),score=28.74 TRINITY_DN7046_c0_g1_i1:299-991(-)